jgi:hypothetical protein
MNDTFATGWPIARLVRASAPALRDVAGYAGAEQVAHAQPRPPSAADRRSRGPRVNGSACSPGHVLAATLPTATG